MNKFEEYIENFNIYNDNEEKKRIIKRCMNDFEQLKYFNDLNIVVSNNHNDMQLRNDEVKKSFSKVEVFANSNSNDINNNYFVV